MPLSCSSVLAKPSSPFGLLPLVFATGWYMDESVGCFPLRFMDRVHRPPLHSCVKKTPIFLKSHVPVLPRPPHTAYASCVHHHITSIIIVETSPLCLLLILPCATVLPYNLSRIAPPRLALLQHDSDDELEYSTQAPGAGTAMQSSPRGHPRGHRIGGHLRDEDDEDEDDEEDGMYGGLSDFASEPLGRSCLPSCWTI